LLVASQLSWSLITGTYMAHRWKRTWAVRLFHLPLGGAGFFTVGASEAQDAFVLLRNYPIQGVLNAYTTASRLPVL
jgi:hypothetical protein